MTDPKVQGWLLDLGRLIKTDGIKKIEISLGKVWGSPIRSFLCYCLPPEGYVVFSRQSPILGEVLRTNRVVTIVMNLSKITTELMM